MGWTIGRLAVCSLIAVIAWEAQLPAGAADDQLDPKIPPAHPEKYRHIRDAKDWANPYLVIRADGIEVIAKALPRGRKVVSAKELQKTLISLPVSAWPYGKVVAVQEISIRSGNDDALIEQNKTEAEKILKALQVQIEAWPSA
jgi:hypothetical protein